MLSSEVIVDGLYCMVGGIPLSTLVLAFVQAPSFTSFVVVVGDAGGGVLAWRKWVVMGES